MQLFTGRLAMIGLMFIGPFLAWQGYSETQRTAEVNSAGENTVGAIIEGEVKLGRRGSRNYAFLVRYQPPGSEPIVREFPVTESAFDEHIQGEAIVVSEVPLRYLPSDPESATLVGASSDTSATMYFGLIVSAIGWGWCLAVAFGLFAPES